MSSQYHFQRLLDPAEEAVLAATAEWRWIASAKPDLEAPIRHERHARWMRGRGNTHAPACREAMLTFRGRAVHSLNDHVYERRPGTVMLFDHYESRDLLGAAHKRGFHCLWLHFHSSRSLTYNSNSCDHEGRYFQEIPPRIVSGEQVRLAMEAWDHCRKKPSDRLGWELLKGQMTALLLDAFGRHTEAASSEHHGQVVESVERYIRSHLADALPLQCLAQIAGYSPFFFHRIFQKHTGLTPVAYINRVRLERSRECLLQGLTTQATAESVGFASVSYFSRLFRRHFGCPPGEWAALARKGAHPAPAVSTAKTFA